MPKKIIKFILKILAKRVIHRYKPIIIGVTGSVGKTTTKEVIYKVISSQYKVRKSESNYNDQIGLPLTILGIVPLESNNCFERLRFSDNLIGAIWLAYGLKQKYPDMLVLEYGADKPGDIAYLTDIAQPNIAVVTAVGDVPVHVEYYTSPLAVAKEKAWLIKSLNVLTGRAILNYDDQTVLDMKERTKAQITTFGFNQEADIWVSDISYYISDNKDIGGMTCKIHNRLAGLITESEGFIPAKIPDMIAKHQLYSILSATAVALHLGMNLVDIAEQFEKIVFPKGRMKLIHGVKDSIIIDDTYNASPLSTHAALDTLCDFSTAIKSTHSSKHRKIAIIATMSELGKYTEATHRAIGDFAAQVADIVIAVGGAGVFIGENASKILGDKRVIHVNTSTEASKVVMDLIKQGDIVLVKGSQSQRMEYVVQAIMAEPKKKKELLVRQTDRWK